MADANTKAKPASKSMRSKKLAVMSDAIDTTLAQTPVVQVPFSALEKSPLNVRTVPYPAESVAQLADTIATVGLLQNLVVHVLADGKYGVAAGGRRLAAMHLLTERGSFAPDEAIPVKIVADDIARAVSLIENEQHLKMHPAEQIIGFRALAAEGKTPEQIGDLMGYSSRHVQRCLKLANLDASLLNELAQDTLSLEQCQMLALENDQERQVQVWEQAKQYYNGTGVPPGYLRNKIVSDELVTGSGLFRFVGEAAYEAAGGVIRRDLFSNDESSWADRHLTETLALKKLEAHAQHVMAEEGWQDDFTWLLDWPQEFVLKLLGFCVAFGIDGVQERLYNRTERSPLEGVEAALNFDLREWWQPTAEGYFCKLSRNQICEALTDAGFSGRASDAMKMKRGDAATAAAEAISSTRWVPDWMTRPQPQESATQNDSTVTGLNETDHAA